MSLYKTCKIIICRYHNNIIIYTLRPFIHHKNDTIIIIIIVKHTITTQSH